MNDLIDLELDDVPKKQTGKWILVGLLAVGLIGLNLWPSGDTATPPDVKLAEAYPGANQTALSSQPRKSVAWPEFSLDNVVRINPFRRSKERLVGLASQPIESELATNSTTTSAPSPTITSQAPPMKLAEEQYPVRFVFHGPRGRAAMIADQIVYEGTQIDGMQVVEISASSVTLRPID